MEILTSYPLLERVVNRLELCAKFYQKGHVKSKSIIKLPFDFKLTRPLDSIVGSNRFFISVKKSGFKITNETKDIELSFPEFDTTTSEHQLPFELKWSSEFKKNELIGRDFEVLLVPKKSAVLNIKSKIQIKTIDVVFNTRKYGESKWKNNFINFMSHIIFNVLYLFKLRFTKN